MSSGFVHTGNPDIPAGEFVDLDGDFIVNGIAEFLPNCLDKNTGLPCFTVMNGLLKVGVKLRRPDGGEGPAFAATPAEFVALVNAFGAEFTPSRDNRTKTETLLAGQEKANAAAKQFTVTAVKSWVNKFPEVDLPEGQYTVRFVGAHNFSPNAGDYTFPAPRDNYKPSLSFQFEVVGDETGEDTVYDGYVISLYMTDVFEEETPEGQKAVDLGLPVFTKTAAGGVPFDVTRWEKFIKYFAPSVTGHEWQTDPQKSRWGVCEVLKPQYVVINRALADNTRVKITYKKRAKSARRYFELMELHLQNKPPKVAEAATEELSTVTITDLVDYVSTRFGAGHFDSVTEDEVRFSEAGRVWAKKYLEAPWERAGIKGRKGFHALRPDERAALMAEFIAQWGDNEPAGENPW